MRLLTVGHDAVSSHAVHHDVSTSVEKVRGYCSGGAPYPASLGRGISQALYGNDGMNERGWRHPCRRGRAYRGSPDITKSGHEP